MSREDADTKEVETKQAPPADDEGRELDRQIAQYLRLGLPAATIVCAIVAGVLQGAAAVVLVIAGGALVSVIALFWASVRTLVGETALSGADAYALGAPRAEEEQKRAVLRALKDLEFERSVGKISEEDYQALVAKYRAEGKRLIRMLDEDALPRRERVEDMVARRLFEEGLGAPPPEPYRGAKAESRVAKKKGKPAKADGARPGKPAGHDGGTPAVAMGAPPPNPRPGAQQSPAPADGADADAKPACASCGTRNDADAAFCKKCGVRLQATEDGGEPEADAEEKTSQESTS